MILSLKLLADIPSDRDVASLTAGLNATKETLNNQDGQAVGIPNCSSLTLKDCRITASAVSEPSIANGHPVRQSRHPALLPTAHRLLGFRCHAR